ncbi:MAG: zinc ribbon domain-containing protein [Deltaproteobacteria bacterium]|nr:zinc ribbon domain-containing protein [Deltaproteobacteria bacterium]
MPIYEFKCKKCSNVFEILFRSSNESLAVSCPACKSKKTEKLMSIFGGKVGSTSSASCSSCAATSCGS